jgi:hypothetical protein
MGKLPMKKLVIISSTFLFFTSCYLNKNIQGKNKKIYFEKIENFSNQPNLTFILKEKLEETFLEYPEFEITNSDKADYLIDLKILKFERIPLFFSKKDTDNIVGAKFEIEIEFNLKLKDGKFINKKFTESVSTSIYKEYNEEEILFRICKRISKKLYFEILKIK